MTSSTDRDPTTATTRPRREPIRTPLLWVALAVSLMLVVPWWAPSGSIEPFVLGLPWWFVVSLLGSLLFSAVTCWACLRRWDLVEDEEEGR